MTNSAEWCFSFKDGPYLSDSDSDDDTDCARAGQELDISGRHETVEFKPNPFNIAKINAASRKNRAKITALSGSTRPIVVSRSTTRLVPESARSVATTVTRESVGNTPAATVAPKIRGTQSTLRPFLQVRRRDGPPNSISASSQSRPPAPVLKPSSPTTDTTALKSHRTPKNLSGPPAIVYSSPFRTTGADSHPPVSALIKTSLARGAPATGNMHWTPKNRPPALPPSTAVRRSPPFRSVASFSSPLPNRRFSPLYDRTKENRGSQLDTEKRNGKGH